jgi:hypothetical protein
MKAITYTNLLGEEVTVGPKGKVNPLLAVFGKLDGDKKCKECSHLYRKHYSKVYIKCNWPACKKFIPKV